MDISGMPLKAVKQLLADNPSQELAALLLSDERKSVQALYKSYERAQQERERVAELYVYEKACRARGHELVAGVDEVGRGPLAGPVVVAAVILPPDCFIEKLNDSKKLSEKTREKLYEIIMAKAVAVKWTAVDEKTIDRINIYQASMNGMYEAIYGLDPQPQEVLIDAMPLNRLEIPSQSIVKGDAKSASIAAASIIAKVTRDRMMEDFDRQYPQYGFAKNKGYGTAEHLAALRQYGPCPIHRRSFEPIRSMTGFDS